MKDSFHFLREVDENTYIERYGIDFEDFEVGDIYEHRPGKTFTEEEVIRRASSSLDQTPHFVDWEYGRALEGGQLRIPETFLMASMALTTKTFGKVVANLSMTNFSMKPVFAGDTIYYESEILDKRASKSRPEQGLMHVETRAANQHGVVVVTFQRKFLIYRKGKGPYEAAGYSA